MLVDGLNEGFRAPDLGWVGSHRPTEIEAQQFETGSILFSNWWAGLGDEALALAKALVQDFNDYLPGMTPEDPSDEFIPVVSVGGHARIIGLGVIQQGTNELILVIGVDKTIG